MNAIPSDFQFNFMDLNFPEHEWGQRMKDLAKLQNLRNLINNGSADYYDIAAKAKELLNRSLLMPSESVEVAKIRVDALNKAHYKKSRADERYIDFINSTQKINEVFRNAVQNHASSKFDDLIKLEKSSDDFAKIIKQAEILLKETSLSEEERSKVNLLKTNTVQQEHRLLQTECFLANGKFKSAYRSARALLAVKPQHKRAKEICAIAKKKLPLEKPKANPLKQSKLPRRHAPYKINK